MHSERMEKRRSHKLERCRSKGSGKTAKKDNVAERRFAQTHRLIHSMNRKRRVNIPKPIAFVGHLFCRLVKSGSRRKFGDHSQNLSSRCRCRHTCASFIDSVQPMVGGWQWGSAAGRTVFTSELAFTAKNLLNL